MSYSTPPVLSIPPSKPASNAISKSDQLLGKQERQSQHALAARIGLLYVSYRSAAAETLAIIPITAYLAGLALSFAVLIGVPLGVLSAVRQNSLLDYVVRVVSLSGLSVPQFWLGLLVMMGSVAWFGTIPIFSAEPQDLAATVTMYAVPAAIVGILELGLPDAA